MQQYQKGNQFKRVFGAIKYGGKAARMGILVRLVAPITSKIAFRFIKKKEENYENLKGIFIICPPRSGGTVVFQAIAHSLPTIPLTNAHVLFLNKGSDLFRKCRLKGSHIPNQFSNFNGYTSSLVDVNEGNEFLFWIHKDQAFLKENFTRFINILSPQKDECVVIKNVRAFDGIQSFYRASENTKFVFVRVKRKRKKVVESSLRVYKDTGVFHPIPRELRGKKIKNPIRFAVDQINYIEKEIDKQLSVIPATRKFNFHYEDFCSNPYKFINQLATEYLGYKKEDVILIPAINNLKIANKLKVSIETSRKISEYLTQ